MVHTYRNRQRNKRLRDIAGAQLFWLAMGVFFVGAFVFAGSPQPLVGLLSVPFYLLWMLPVYWDFSRRYYEIQLSDEGSCEFRAALGSKHLRAQQIISVQRNSKHPLRWEDDEADHTVLRFQGGRLGLVLMQPVDDFEDFLARLQALNPAVEMRGN